MAAYPSMEMFALPRLAAAPPQAGALPALTGSDLVIAAVLGLGALAIYAAAAL